ncbi:MAG: serine/threonine protein kinase [Deltaproteobacteria bacterium]|nr:serine/threonine protein kinase [Deltaproteobacteria bacterium]
MLQSEKFGRYRLLRQLATGGMAEIYLAKLLGAEGFEKDIAIKKILPQWSSDRNFIEMLIDEAKIAVQLNHPNVIQVYEFAREDRAYYIAMEYVHGVDLRRVMQKAASLKKRVPIDIALTIMAEVLEGLAYSHSKKDSQGNPLQIVHRDISPQNILVSYEGSVKITDFGIAKAASKNHDTSVGVLKGKFAYMSPEQANQLELDHRSDLFSAAVVLYELLAGERLFFHHSDLETLDRVRRGDVQFSPKAEKILPQRVRDVLFKALAKNPDERYPDATSFREEIAKILRRSKKGLQRERVACFVSELFSSEIENETLEKTKIATDSGTALLVDHTESIAVKEVLVQREGLGPLQGTVMLSPAALGKKAWRYDTRKVAVIATGLYVLIYSGSFFMKRMKESSLPKAMIKTTESSVKPQQEGQRPESPRLLPPELPPPIQENQAVSANAPLPEAPTLKGSDQETKKGLTEANGFLSVQAIPWGYVTIDGGAQRRETPLRRLALKSGSHKVEIRYEPEGIVVSSNIELANGQEIVCLANFKGNKEIRCGN